MRFIDILRIAFSTFINNKMRIVLTVFGVAVGIGAVVFLFSIGYGLQKITIGEITSIKALSTMNVSSGNSNILSLNNKSLDQLKSIEHVESADPNLSVSGQISNDKSKTDLLVNIASAQYLDLESPRLQAGSLYASNNEEQVVLTSVIANAFDVRPEEMLGRKVKISAYIPNPDEPKSPNVVEKELTVVGIIRENVASYAYIPNSLIKLPSDISYTSIKLKVDDTKNLSNVKQKVVDGGYKASSVGEEINQMNQVFNIAKLFLLILGAIALFVASIGMFNTLTISLLERTRDIGIMKSLGATDHEVYAIFLTESTLIGLFGGSTGLAIALILGNLLNGLISFMATRAGGEPVDIFQVPIVLVVSIICFSVLVGFLTGVYPAKRAAKINPLDALRYE